MTIPKIITVPSVIQEVVDMVAAKSGIDAKFYHDTPEKLEARLLLKDNAQAIKYPAFLLFHDFPEQLGVQYYADVTIPKIAIATTTKPEYFADQRYTVNFIPTLYPLYEWFKKCLAMHHSIVQSDPNNIVMTKYDRLYWGTTSAGQQLNDYLDAIELSNLKLTINQKCK